jgi:hypothetical protein
MPAPTSIPKDVDEFIEHWRSIPKTGAIPCLRAFLDFPPFRLQSEVAIVDVNGPEEMRFRLFGTGLSEIAGLDLTGTDVLSNFHKKARKDASRIAWIAVNRPCGYIIRRELRRGSVGTSAIGAGLPLLHNQSGKIGLVGFSSTLEKKTHFTLSDADVFVTDVKRIQWIDIGAGTP